MSDFYQLDFLAVETDKSGDAIALQGRVGGGYFINVVDGGFVETGARLVEHIRNYYDHPELIDNVVVTHQDGDHTKGLKSILENFSVGTLWMFRPWLYSEVLKPLFPRFASPKTLADYFRSEYANIAELETIALQKSISISFPSQGAQIGPFTVLAPSAQRYIELLMKAEELPLLPSAGYTSIASGGGGIAKSGSTALVHSPWGEEVFSSEYCGHMNEMSVVQYAVLNGRRILLTGDAGPGTLNEAINYAPKVGLALPGIDLFQVPHHGSRRNARTDILDKLLGPRLAQQAGSPRFQAIISSAKKDPDHPRKAVVRAMIHRGGAVTATEGRTVMFNFNRPRPGWGDVAPEAYPTKQESA